MVPEQHVLDDLYSTKKKSIAEISQLLNISNTKVAYWMRKYGIKCRSRSDAGYIKANPDGDPFLNREPKTFKDYFLAGLGLGIYWGEGNKVNKHSLRVTNTDPRIIKAFRAYIISFFTVSESKFTYSLICFNDNDKNAVKNYWSGQLGVNPDKFGKITVISTQGKGTYKKKSEFGVCIIQISNVKLRKLFMDKLVSIQNNFA